MGLQSGEHGCKAVLQQLFPEAFESCPHLEGVRASLVGVGREEALAVLDGNVMVRSVPQSATTFAEHVQLFVGQLTLAIDAAKHVVVVFDEPQAMTRAKREEQERRDVVARASDDSLPTTDAYTDALLRSERCNVYALMQHRAARPRFIDALCVASLGRLVETTRGAAGLWGLAFDGIDARGASRRTDAPRTPGVLSTADAFWAPLLARAAPIGEGDLKLTDVTQRVHDAALRPGSPVEGVVLNLVTTIDTDSLLIELLKQQARSERPGAEDRNELTIVCLREPARKRKGGDDAGVPARYLCCDVDCLRRSVLAYLGPVNGEDEVGAVALLVAACVLCGCDFVKLAGLRVDRVLPVVQRVVRARPDVLEAMAQVFDTDPAVARGAGAAIETVLDAYAQEPRARRSRVSASQDRDTQVLRALWVLKYWSGCQVHACAEWGFAA